MEGIRLSVLVNDNLIARISEHLHIIPNRLAVGRETIFCEDLYQFTSTNSVVVICVFKQISQEEYDS